MLNSWKISIILTTTLLLVSCRSLHIEKRVHRKGYYIHWNKPIKSTHDRTSETASNSFVLDSLQNEKIKHEEILTSNISESNVVSTPISSQGEFKTAQKIAEQNDLKDPEQFIATVDLSEDPIDPNNENSDVYKERGKGYRIAGLVLIILGISISLVLITLGGGWLGLAGFILLIPGLASLRFAKQSKLDSHSNNPDGRINLVALIAWTLLPFNFIGGLMVFVLPAIMILLIFATIQFNANPEKYKAKWMVYVLWLILIAAAVYFGVILIYSMYLW